MLVEFAGAGEAFVAGGADMPFAAIAASAALGLGGGPRGARARGGALALFRPTWQGGHSSGSLYRAEALLDAPARSRGAKRDVLQLGGQLRGGRRYECFLRGGRAFPGRLLREFGAALLAFSRVRWRTGHLALIFNDLTLYRFSLSTRRGRGGSEVAVARRDGRKHFCHIDGLEALFRIRVTCFSRNFWGSESFSTI